MGKHKNLFAPTPEKQRVSQLSVRGGTEFFFKITFFQKIKSTFFTNFSAVKLFLCEYYEKL